MADFGELCRLCRARNEEPIEEWPHLFHDGNEHLLDKIQSCTNVQPLEHDPFPKQICLRCQTTLELAHAFRAQCDKADRLWQHQLESLGKSEEAVVEPANQVMYFYRGTNNRKSSWNKRFKCRFCPKHFGRMCRLREHELEHSGVPKGFLKKKVKGNASIEVPVQDEVVQDESVKILDEQELVEVIVKQEPEDVVEPEPVVEPEQVPPVDVMVQSALPLQVEPATDDVMYFYIGQNKRFQCKSCPRHFARKCRLRDHVELEHKKVPESTIVETSSTVVKQEEVDLAVDMPEPEVEHFPEPEPGPAVLAEAGLSLEPGNQEVMVFYRAPTNDRNSWNKRFQCRFCPRHFGRKCRLKEHEARHSGVRNFLCAKCNSSFYTDYDLRLHEERSHLSSSIWTFSCDKCHNRFKTQEGLDKHAKRHLIPKVFKCDMCTKSFTTKYHLQCHQDTHLPKDTTKLRPQDLNRICMCPHCGEISHTHNTHVLHLRTHMSEETNSGEAMETQPFVDPEIPIDQDS